MASVLAGLVACATNPVTGKKELALISEKQEIELGTSAAKEITQTIGLYEDQAVQAFVADVGKRLAARSERPRLPWSFQVVDDAAVNAFALPGGKIFVTRGLMTHLDSEAQLAAVLGHEIGHVTARHSVKALSRAQLAQLGLGVGMILSDEVRKVGQVASAGLGLIFLKYGRDAENQADELGFRYALQNRYDVREMPDVFATLKRASEGEGGRGRLPVWLSTHPDPESRIAKTRDRLARMGQVPAGTVVGRADYLRVTDGMVFGADPRDGYFRGSTFSHPELRFTMQVPQGWEAANLAQAVVAQSPAEDAALELTLVPPQPPDEALRRFLAKEGIRSAGQATSPVPGLPSVSVPFTAQVQGGVLAGIATYVSHAGRTFQILSYAGAQKAGSYEATFRRAHASFAPLTDPVALSVQPARIDIERVPAPMTLADFNRVHPSTVPLDVLARINQVEPQTPLEPGQLVKTVEGGPPPEMRIGRAALR